MGSFRQRATVPAGGSVVDGSGQAGVSCGVEDGDFGGRGGRLAAHGSDGGPVEDGPTGCKGEGVDLLTWAVAQKSVEHERGEQRSVNDKAGVALVLDAEVAIVVDAVGVEGQRGVPEEQRLVRPGDPAVVLSLIHI